MFVLEGGAEELKAELQRWVELPNQLLNALMVSDMHVFNMVAVGSSVKDTRLMRLDN